jgi:type IV secretory pathway VirB2 component (pilin)
VIQEAFFMMDHMGGMMMWGMGLVWILLVIVLVLTAAALVKYLISK